MLDFVEELHLQILDFIFIFCILSMREQAEDVVGSLLKEYLNVTEKEGEISSDTNPSDGTSSASKKSEEIPCASEKSDEVPATEERNTLTDGIEQDSVAGRMPENNANALETSEVASQEKGSQLNGCKAENGTSLAQQFKNVVAIVDPPRGGLHPIVSAFFFKLSWSFFLYFSQLLISVSIKLVIVGYFGNNAGDKGPENPYAFKEISVSSKAKSSVHFNLFSVFFVFRTYIHNTTWVLCSYISCNPESLMANAIELCTPSSEKTEKGNKNNRGWRNMGSAGLARHRVKSMPMSEPFRPVKAMAVDLFPHTPHCEMVMLLER